MIKSTKLLKRFAALFLVVLLSIESFAAAVSDNNGAAFITKAEFDSMKNHFQSQLNEYTSNIDNKIDASVEGYLRGVKILHEPTNLIEQFEQSTGEKMRWLFAIPGRGSSTRTANITITTTGYVTRYSVSNFYFNVGTYCWDDSSAPAGFKCYAQATLMFGSGHPFMTDTGYGRWAFRLAKSDINQGNGNFVVVPTTWTGSYDSNYSQATYAYYNNQDSYTETTSNGSGSGWLWQTINGVPELKYYCTALYPKIDLNFYVHWYRNFSLSSYASSYVSTSGFSFSGITLPSLDTLVLELGRTKSLGTKYGANSTSNGKYVSGEANLVRTTNGVNYLNTVWGISNTGTIYANNEDYNGTAASGTTSTTWPTSLKWSNEYWSPNGLQEVQSSFPGSTTNYKLINYPAETHKISDFGNSTLSVLAGTQIMNGDGAPCFKTNDNDYNVTVDFKLTKTSGTANCQVVFSDQPFNNGSIRSGAKNLGIKTATTGTNYSMTFNVPKEGIVYMFVKNNTNTDPITIDTFKCK